MALNITQAREILQRYINAEQEVLEGRSVTFGGRTLSMESLGEIRKGRQEWERKVAALEGARPGRRPYKLAEFL